MVEKAFSYVSQMKFFPRHFLSYKVCLYDISQKELNVLVRIRGMFKQKQKNPKKAMSSLTECYRLSTTPTGELHCSTPKLCPFCFLA